MPRPRCLASEFSFSLVLLLGLGFRPGVVHAEPNGDDAGGSTSGGASVSLGRGAQANGKSTAPGDKPAKQTDDRPFFERYKPTNHMVNAGLYMGAFWRANNHGIFDRGQGSQPTTPRSAFDIGGRLEYMPIPWVGIGFEAGGMPTRSPSESGAKGSFYTVRAHVIGSMPYRLTPTLAVGVGLLGLRSREAEILNSGDAAFHWGPGAKFFVNDWVAVRLDGRHMVTGDSIDGRAAHHGELLVGVEVNLRLTRWVGNKWRESRSDSDGDSIIDTYDECPDEFGEGDDGCPLNRDRDGDGIPDGRDQCPSQWGDGADGCPSADKDGDGVLDLEDQCEDQPETNNGFEDEDGCPDELPEEIKKFTGVVEGIYFDTGKATIRSKSRRVLDKVVALLEKYPSLRLEVSGHTDDSGTHDDNVSLSENRAKAVKEYLVNKGIDESRLSTRGAGPDEPIADNQTKGGRAKNRRIEFKAQ